VHALGHGRNVAGPRPHHDVEEREQDGQGERLLTLQALREKKCGGATSGCLILHLVEVGKHNAKRVLGACESMKRILNPHGNFFFAARKKISLRFQYFMNPWRENYSVKIRQIRRSSHTKNG
jgi:hypothetical protein